MYRPGERAPYVWQSANFDKKVQMAVVDENDLENPYNFSGAFDIQGVGGVAF
jgi:hypothetical protein